LISTEALEASTTVEQGSVEIEHHGANIPQHLFYKTLIRICRTIRAEPRRSVADLAVGSSARWASAARPGCR
jgi:hypothetical protein